MPIMIRTASLADTNLLQPRSSHVVPRARIPACRAGGALGRQTGAVLHVVNHSGRASRRETSVGQGLTGGWG